MSSFTGGKQSLIPPPLFNAPCVIVLGNGGGEGGIYGQRGEKGGEVFSFSSELYFNKANKVFWQKRQIKGYNYIEGVAKMATAKIRKYACFTKEQQQQYERLTQRQRLYVDFRGKGNQKKDAYIMAGFNAKVAAQAAYILEKRNTVLADLIACIQNQAKVRELSKEDSDLNTQIDALAKQEGVEKALEAIEGADGETAKRIQFYRDIINGKIKTVRVTKRYNAMGGLIEKKVVEADDVDTRMKARRELDNILGLTTIPDLSTLQMGDITIHIVDASKKEELADSRNTVDISDKIDTIDGETVIVADEKEEVVEE